MAVKRSMPRAVELMNDTAADYRIRAAAIRFLQLGDVNMYVADIKKHIAPTEEPVVQMAALETISKAKGTQVSEFVIQQWPVLTPEVRSEAVNTFLTDSARIRLLLDALEKNTINTSSVTFSTSVTSHNRYENADVSGTVPFGNTQDCLTILA